MDELMIFRNANPEFFHNEFIAHYCAGLPLVIGLRGTCRAWRECIKKPERMYAQEVATRALRENNVELAVYMLSVKCMELLRLTDELLREIERIGFQGQRDYVEFLISKIGNKRVFKHLFIGAARASRLDICKIICDQYAKEIDDSDFGCIIKAAARSGNQSALDMMVSFALATDDHRERDTKDKYIANRILCGAASSGNRELFESAYESIDAPAIDDAAICAARNGQAEIFDLIIKLRDEDFIDYPIRFEINALYKAANRGHVEMCKCIFGHMRRVINTWELTTLAQQAFRGGHIGTCALVREWQLHRAIHFSDLISEVFECTYENREVQCEFWRAWFEDTKPSRRDLVRMYRPLLGVAINCGNLRACVLVRKWIESLNMSSAELQCVFDDAHDAVYQHAGYRNCIEFAHEWATSLGLEL